MSPLEDWLDRQIARAVKNARREFATMNQTDFSGAVAGFLMATAIKLAHSGGCPQDVLERSIVARIRQTYGGSV